MRFTLATLVASAFGLSSAADIYLTLYADNACSVLVGGVTVENGTCTVPTVSSWSSMDLSSPPTEGSIEVFCESDCTGETYSTNGLYLGCMNNFGFDAKSVDFTSF